MSFELTSKDYLEYMQNAAALINSNKDYISELDAATGDGDHWANMNLGFTRIVESSAELETLDLISLFKKIGMLMMTTIGGSSGVLYGSGYIRAAKELDNISVIDQKTLAKVLVAMVKGICERGKSEPGMKTMIDTLYPASRVYQDAVSKGMDERDAINLLKQTAYDGMENTKNMEAMRGRACYQTEKGIGKLDPGAVTMYYQISALADLILEKIK